MPVDITEFLQPIPGDQPSGTDHAGNPEFLTLQADVKKQRKEADGRRVYEETEKRLQELGRTGGSEAEMKTLQQSLTANPLEPGPGWKKIKDVSGRLLSQRTKDLEIACYWTESSTEIDGFAGFGAGIRVLDGIIQNFWETCYPALSQDGDDFRRWSKLLALDNLSSALERQALVVKKDAAGARPFTYYEWKLGSGRTSTPKGLSETAKDDWEKRVKDAEERWEQITKTIVLDELKVRTAILAECVAALEKLQESVTAKFRPADAGDEPRDLNRLLKDLKTCHGILADLVTERSAAPADGAGGGGDGGEASADGGGSGGGGTSGARGRADAVRRIREAAAYFRSAEPSSPIAYLLDRAVRWSELPFDALLRDMMDNQDALGAIDKLLGIKPPQT